MVNKPFDMKYVMAITVSNMQKAIEFSIKRTFDRIPEFADDPAKSKELFLTLAKLHAMKKQMEKFKQMDGEA